MTAQVGHYALDHVISELFKGWWRPLYGIRYHHISDERHFKDNFGDTVHHTGAVTYALKKLNKLTTRKVNGFQDFYWARMKNGIFYRDIINNQSCNRDQMTFGCPAIFICMGERYATHALSAVRKHSVRICKKEYVERDFKPWEFIQPHHIVFFRRARRLKTNWPLRVLGDLFELGDVKLDLMRLKREDPPSNGLNSSLVKNVVRNMEAQDYQPTFLTKKFTKLVIQTKPRAAFNRYFSKKHAGNDKVPHWIGKLWELLLIQKYNL